MMFLCGPANNSSGALAPTGLASRPTGAPSKKHSHPSPLKIVLKNNPWRSWRLGGSPVRLFWTALTRIRYLLVRLPPQIRRNIVLVLRILLEPGLGPARARAGELEL